MPSVFDSAPSTPGRRLVWILLGVAAALNLAAALALALGEPVRASDLFTIYGWCRSWLLGGANLYAGSEASTDYPPNAIVMLSPLVLLPWRWAVPVWTAVALVLTPLLPYVVVRCHSRHEFRFAAPMLLFFCWSSSRTLLQFSLMSMTLMFAS